MNHYSNITHANDASILHYTRKVFTRIIFAFFATTFLYNNNGEKPEKIQMHLESQQV